jgi:hypothetical protein
MELGIQFQVRFFKKNSDSENQTQFQPVAVWFLLTQTGIGSLLSINPSSSHLFFKEMYSGFGSGSTQK